jgi:hypothetical protein
MARQAAAFLAISVISLVVASWLTGVAAAQAPGGHDAHVVVVAVAYVGVYGMLWVAKFVVYQWGLLRPGQPSPPTTASAPPKDRPSGAHP